MNEHGFVNSIHRKLRGDERIDFWKINDQYAGGVPDAIYFGNRSVLWVEYKYIAKPPKKESTVIDLCHDKYLSALQQKWLRRKYLLNTRIAVIVGTPYGHRILEGLDWTKPLTIIDFMDALDVNDIVSYLLETVHTP